MILAYFLATEHTKLMDIKTTWNNRDGLNVSIVNK